jgi:hypothetical protein
MLLAVPWLWFDGWQREYNVCADKREIPTKRRSPLGDIVDFRPHFFSHDRGFVLCGEEDYWVFKATVEAILNVVEGHGHLCDSLWIDEHEHDAIWLVGWFVWIGRGQAKCVGEGGKREQEEAHKDKGHAREEESTGRKGHYGRGEVAEDSIRFGLKGLYL